MVIMNRALWKPAFVAIIVLAVVTVSGLLLRSSTGSAKTSDVLTADDQIPAVADKPKAADAVKTRETSRASSSPTTGDGPNSAEERRQLLETIGVLTAAHCYQTYFNIGLIADGKARGTYTEKDAYKLIDTVLSLLDSVDRKLAGLDKIDLDKADRDSLEQMRDLADLLRQQGKGLQLFWDTGKDEDAARYENVRKDSWAAICKLMGIGR